MPDQLSHHRRNNLATQEAWAWYAEHRKRVTAELLAVTGDSLAVWGAGNCNDLDLPRLLKHFRRVSLYDLDLQAMAAGLQRQGMAGNSRIKLIEADAVELAASALRVAQLPRHAVVASLALLSQILHYAQLALAQAQEACWPELEILRSRHLRMLLETTRPQGNTLLFNDFLSSDTCPELLYCATHELPRLLQKELEQGNFFTGLHPAAVEQWIAAEAQSSGGVASHSVSSPWQWHLGGGRCYAICLHRIQHG